MQEQIANIVYPVIEYGLALQAKFNSGQPVDVEREQAQLQSLLLSEDESRFHPGFGRDEPSANETFGDGQRMSTSFLGVRYALVCWLDELFTMNERSCEDWQERKLESRLYGTNDRAWKFWEQARIAHVRLDPSELEVFFLCVSLGFRGDRRNRSDDLRSWIGQAKLRLGKVDELDFPFATEMAFHDVPILHGEARFRRMAITCWMALLLVIPLVSFVLMRKFGE